MQKHQIGLSWSDMEKGLLTLEDKVLVETIDICEIGPQLIAYSSLTLPPRMLVVNNVHVDLKEILQNIPTKLNQTSLLLGQYPNMVIMPVIHIMPKQADAVVPFVINNLSTKCIFLAKCEILGFLDQTDTEICEIMTSSASEPLAVEVTSE